MLSTRASATATATAQAATKTYNEVLETRNVYFFRNMINHSVIVSKTFAIQDSAFAKTGYKRPQQTLRPDHWVPFAIVTGLQSKNQQETILAKTSLRGRFPLGKQAAKLPLRRPRDEEGRAVLFPGWKVPDQVVECTAKLCDALTQVSATSLNRYMGRVSRERSGRGGRGRGSRGLVEGQERRDVKVGEETSSTSLTLQPPSNTENSSSSNDSLSLLKSNFLSNFKVTVHWERPDYQYELNNFQRDDEVSTLARRWPETVSHEKLSLIKNRYPKVPGFNTKTRMEEHPPVQRVVVKPLNKVEFFRKKQSTWKTKNEIVLAPNVLHKYGSKHGKSYPIIKRTAETSRYRLEREFKAGEIEEKRKEAIALHRKKQK